ncbi:CopD family protein [Pelagicoccus enzymogenes]|uniref:CopD family protein n=1 Tax=Pelagicoccus enzymogenes TaxID=2773457 RepID=UPI00280CF11D|nr:CopD family protein [Pelagicoccus enzymogenes]MDQ8198879.1 CopD family protein [Pelagicoccus enzymogenes]
MGLNIYGSLIVLHLVSACVWVGLLVALSCSLLPQAVRERDGAAFYRIEALYSTVGMPALFSTVATGLVLGYLHLPDFGAWLDFSNPMGRLVGLKLILLAALLGLGVDLRFRLFPKVDKLGIGALRWHAALITVLSLLLVFVGASFRIGWLY